MSKNTKMHAKRLGRELAMQFLFQNDLTGENGNPDETTWQRFVEQASDAHQIGQNRQARKGFEYAAALIAGIKSHLHEIDLKIIERSDKWDWPRMALVDRNVMRVAVYEMLFVPDVPPIVSINEAVEVVRDYSGEKAGNFINGILDSIKDTLSRPAREPVEKL